MMMFMMINHLFLSICVTRDTQTQTYSLYMIDASAKTHNSVFKHVFIVPTYISQSSTIKTPEIFHSLTSLIVQWLVKSGTPLSFSSGSFTKFPIFSVPSYLVAFFIECFFIEKLRKLDVRRIESDSDDWWWWWCWLFFKRWAEVKLLCCYLWCYTLLSRVWVGLIIIIIFSVWCQVWMCWRSVSGVFT